MTCIVGLVDKGDIYMGGDSAGVAGLSITIRADEKVFTNGEFIMGFTSSFRMGQLLRYKFEAPKQLQSQSDMKYMVTDFIDAVQKCFVEHGFGSKTSGGNFLVGYNGNLYNIQSDYQVGLSHKAFESVGCGSDLAMGSMYTSSGKKPEARVLLALETASMFSIGVAAPFVVLKQPKAKKTK